MLGFQFSSGLKYEYEPGLAFVFYVSPISPSSGGSLFSSPLFLIPTLFLMSALHNTSGSQRP